MKDVDRILRAEDLQKRYRKLVRRQHAIEEEENKLIRECMHEIVVIADHYYKRCLFCRKLSNNPRSFDISGYIDVSYKLLPNSIWAPELKFKVVTKLYIKAAKKHPKLNTSQLLKIVERQIEENTPEVEEIVKLLLEEYNK